MDIIYQEKDLKLIKKILKEFEIIVYKEKCSSIIYLNGDKEISDILKSNLYFRSGIKYNILVYPKKFVIDDSQMMNLSNWRFVFGDHDVF